MDIHEIKEHLTLATVLHYYGLKTDKQSRLSCPFHEDKTPSLQVYYKTQTAYCFSSNCKTPQLVRECFPQLVREQCH